MLSPYRTREEVVVGWQEGRNSAGHGELLTPELLDILLTK